MDTNVLKIPKCFVGGLWWIFAKFCQNSPNLDKFSHFWKKFINLECPKIVFLDRSKVWNCCNIIEIVYKTQTNKKNFATMHGYAIIKMWEIFMTCQDVFSPIFAKIPFFSECEHSSWVSVKMWLHICRKILEYIFICEFRSECSRMKIAFSNRTAGAR